MAGETDPYSILGRIGDFKDIFYGWNGGNEWLFFKINGIRGNTYDLWMALITRMADKGMFVYYLLALVLIASLILLYRKIRNRGGARYYAAMWLSIMIYLGSGYFLDAVTVALSKQYFAMPRPYVVLDHPDIHVLEPQSANEAFRSFPSEHVSFALFLVIGLWSALSERLRWLAVGFVFVVAWSRVALGVHFPADVLYTLIFTGIIMGAWRSFLFGILRKIGING